MDIEEGEQRFEKRRGEQKKARHHSSFTFTAPRHRAGFPGFPGNYQNIIKRLILMDSGGSPENCQKIVKISKIDDFGGPSENPRKIVLGRLKIIKKCRNIVLWTTFLVFFDKKYCRGLRPLPKEGRRPSAAAPLLDNIIVKR